MKTVAQIIEAISEITGKKNQSELLESLEWFLACREADMFDHKDIARLLLTGCSPFNIERSAVQWQEGYGNDEWDEMLIDLRTHFNC